MSSQSFKNGVVWGIDIFPNSKYVLKKLSDHVSDLNEQIVVFHGIIVV
jgi:hypothetical protein